MLRTTPKNEDIVFHADPRDDYASIKEGLPNFQGTVIGIDVHIADTAAFNRLIDRIGNAYRHSLNKMQKDFYKRIRFT